MRGWLAQMFMSTDNMLVELRRACAGSERGVGRIGKVGEDGDSESSIVHELGMGG